MLSLEQNTTKKNQVGNTLLEPQKSWKFEVGDKKKYKIEAIIDSIIYGK